MVGGVVGADHCRKKWGGKEKTNIRTMLRLLGKKTQERAKFCQEGRQTHQVDAAGTRRAALDRAVALAADRLPARHVVRAAVGPLPVGLPVGAHAEGVDAARAPRAHRGVRPLGDAALVLELPACPVEDVRLHVVGALLAVHHDDVLPRDSAAKVRPIGEEVLAVQVAGELGCHCGGR